MAQMNLERGFRRVTWAVSVFAAGPLALFGVAALFEERPDALTALSYIGWVVASFVIPWGLFFLLRWIVRGFVNSP